MHRLGCEWCVEVSAVDQPPPVPVCPLSALPYSPSFWPGGLATTALSVLCSEGEPDGPRVPPRTTALLLAPKPHRTSGLRARIQRAHVRQAARAPCGARPSTRIICMTFSGYKTSDLRFLYTSYDDTRVCAERSMDDANGQRDTQAGFIGLPTAHIHTSGPVFVRPAGRSRLVWSLLILLSQSRPVTRPPA